MSGKWGETKSERRARAAALINRWSIAGAAFTLVVGWLMAMAFAVFGKWRPAGVLFPVNESLWEHLKMAYWPVVLFALIEFVFLRPRTGNLWLATAATALIAVGGTAAFYYAYTTVIGRNLVWADMVCLAVAVALAYLAGAAVMQAREIGLGESIGLTIIVVLGAAFGVFTFMPPHLEPFRDPLHNAYGIVRALLLRPPLHA